jgi:putative iron-regulated protein
MGMRRLRNCIVTALGCGALWGCGGDDSGTRPSFPLETHEAIETYSAIVLASYTDSLATAEDLQDAVDDLVEGPSAATLLAAQNAWKAAREPYLQTEVYRFYGGPIDDEESGPEGLINAWPMDEGHVDYITGDPEDGIINDPSVEIDGETLESLNESPGDKDIATGYHAIEFLLWGQDEDPDGPGARPFTDYIVGAGGTAANQDRRGEYLQTVTDLLIGHLEDLVAAWEDGEDPDAATYAARFHDLSNAEAMTRILTGMTILSSFETGGERLLAALDAKDQEEEHSCFSDNTHRDMIQDVVGIQNVWLGRYTGLSAATTVSDGVGIRDIVASADAELAQSITDQIAESRELAEALHPPFDQEIAEGNTEGNARVSALAVSLRAQGDLIDRAFPLFGLSRPADPN